MLRYLFALVPGLVLFALFYVSKNGVPGEINVLLRDTGRVAFLYLSLALLVTPAITLSGKQWMAKYRRTFGVLAFVFALAHASKYFFDEYTYQKTLFVAQHFLESDVWSGTLAFILIAILGITSNDASVRFLRSHWKSLQTLAYPLFLIAALHVAFASRFEDFYVVAISAVVALRTFAFLKKRKILPVSAVGGSATKYLCVPCGYVYDEAVGDPDGGIPPGTRFEDIPDSWRCPVCGVGKGDFIALASADATNETIAKVVTHRFLNPTVLEFSIETETPLPTIPGQYAKFIFKDRDGDFSRCYSVVSSEGNRLVFCVRVTDGRGGKILAALKVGDDIRISGIFGAFVLASSEGPKVFIATGTGLSPIMNLMRNANGADKRLFFGMRTKEEDFYSDELANIPNLSIRKFLSRGEAKGFETGRIDLSTEPFPEEAEFYVCGNPDMVQSTVSALRARGFEKIYSERY